MIKGIQKNIIIIKGGSGDIFEEAIFIINPKKKKQSESFLIKEAKRIIGEKTDNYSRKRGFFS